MDIKLEAKSMYEAKEVAIAYFKVKKKNIGLIAIAPGYNDNDELSGWIAFYDSKKVEINKI